MGQRKQPELIKVSIEVPLNEVDGFDVHDYLREGRQYELSPRKLSAFLKVLIKQINFMVDEINRLKKLNKGGDK